MNFVHPEDNNASTSFSMLSEQSFLTTYDQYLFNEGTHERIYRKLGAHVTQQAGKTGVHFAVWAPNAQAVSVIGDFNNWNAQTNPMQRLNDSGIWVGFIVGLQAGALYKYSIRGADNQQYEKSDPYGFAAELRPKTASQVYPLEGYAWADTEWMSHRNKQTWTKTAVSIYEVHLGSWMRVVEEGNRWFSYRELAERLIPYIQEMGFTHVEFLPVMEHPLDESWGYQVTGYFAPTSRFGSPHDFMYLIDQLHQHHIGVILDWVPAHFPKDAHGLAFFDGTHLYEHADVRLREHLDWNTYIFNYGRYEVSNFLISNALFWLDYYHIDGLRVDAVASMLYLDYSRQPGQWLPNRFGGRENIEAIDFMRRLNTLTHENYPGVMLIAEESTAWPQVSRPVEVGGLGYDFKWDMGWMNDTLQYMARDPIYRKFNHSELTFRNIYAFTENYLLPLSHDEVVHGKGSLLTKMPGDAWQKFANLKLLFGYQFTQPGKKLLFMGSELAPWDEWKPHQSLDWHLLGYENHQRIQRWIKDLNALYLNEPALYEADCVSSGFHWIDFTNAQESVLIYQRQAASSNEKLIIAINFTPIVRTDYRIEVAGSGKWQEILNSDASNYGGSNVINGGAISTTTIDAKYYLHLTLPPLGITIFKIAN